MRGKPFELGNKIGKGRPPGSRNRRTLFQEVLESRGEAIIKQSQLMAIKGDPTALRLCMERLVPILKPPASRFRLPPMKTAQDVTKVLPAIMRQVSRGRLSAQECESIARVVDTQLRTIEAGEFAERLQALEEDRADRLEPAEEEHLKKVEEEQPTKVEEEQPTKVEEN